MRDTYLRRQRHVLLDMHVPDWDERFLSKFDPKTFVELCAGAGADAVMVYCNSHVGLCYWPTASGRMHPGLAGADVVGTQVELLHERGIAVCAYYSGPVFNNWAYTEHPDWRIVASSPGGMAGPGSRYGVVCPSNADCVEFMLAQVGELVDTYPFDAFFFDMVFWPSVCVCASCRDRFRAEEGAELPDVLDWHSPQWCAFQAARERWLAEAYRRLRDRVRASLDVPVFLNGGIVKFDWWAATGHDLMRLNDLLGGDFAHQSVLPALARLTPSVLQYMKAVTEYGGGASQLMPVREQVGHALAATTFGGQFMAIDAVAPDGTVSPATYERLHDVFDAMRPYEPYLGGVPVADVGVYLSQQASVDFRANGTPLDRLAGLLPRVGAPSPHSSAVEGAVSALQGTHLPFGVLTRSDLDRLDDYAVVVLPNLLRVDPDEVAAFRGYVERGGKLYASGHTSTVGTDGTVHPDFLLADVFGCHADGPEAAAVAYLRPAGPQAGDWVAPLEYVGHGTPDVNSRGFGVALTALRIRAATEAEVLFTTTVTFGDGLGSRDDQGWASIHNSPPWEDTSRPAVVRHRFGAGEAVYSAMDIESDEAQPPGRALFVRIVRSLLGRPPAFEADAHPNVWMTVFHDAAANRLRVCLLNHSAESPALPVPRIRFRLAAPGGAAFSGLHLVPSGEAVPFTTVDGGLEAEVHDLDTFRMLAATYQ